MTGSLCILNESSASENMPTKSTQTHFYLEFIEPVTAANTITMQLTTLFTVAFASVAAAVPDFAIGTQSLFTAKDSAQLAAVTKALYEAASSYQASLTAQPQWTSAYSALVEFQQTGENVPEDVTATDTILTYSTTPDWLVSPSSNKMNGTDLQQVQRYAHRSEKLL